MPFKAHDSKQPFNINPLNASQTILKRQTTAHKISFQIADHLPISLSQYANTVKQKMFK